MHTLRMICQLGFFTGMKKSEMSQIKLFAVAVNTAGGRKQYCSNGGHSVLGSVRPDTLVCLLGRGALDRSLVKTGIMTSPVRGSHQAGWRLEAPPSCGFKRGRKHLSEGIPGWGGKESGPWITCTA